MDKRIVINLILTQTGELVIIPINYEISNPGNNPNRISISCEIDLEEEKLPKWLTCKEFVIRRHHTPGSFGQVGTYITESAGATNEESLALINKAEAEILTKEGINYR